MVLEKQTYHAVLCVKFKRGLGHCETDIHMFVHIVLICKCVLADIPVHFTVLCARFLDFMSMHKGLTVRVG